MKRILLALLAVAGVVAVIASPFGVLQTKAKYEQFNSVVAGYTFAQDNFKNTQANIDTARDAFIARRTFEVDFGDVSRVVQLLNGVNTIQVSKVMCCDALNQFIQTAEWEERRTPSAVCISLSVENTVAALNVLSKMELPIYSISVVDTNAVDVIFLTGGAL